MGATWSTGELEYKCRGKGSVDQQIVVPSAMNSETAGNPGDPGEGRRPTAFHQTLARARRIWDGRRRSRLSGAIVTSVRQCVSMSAASSHLACTSALHQFLSLSRCPSEFLLGAADVSLMKRRGTETVPGPREPRSRQLVRSVADGGPSEEESREGVPIRCASDACGARARRGCGARASLLMREWCGDCSSAWHRDEDPPPPRL